MVDCKKCFKCGEIKSFDEFYKHSAMADGYLNKCKTCTKNDVGQNRAKNLDQIRAYDRERGKSKKRIAVSVAVNRAWRLEDSRRQKAHIAVAKAIRKGDLIRAVCERCGNEKSVAHHEDYDKPLQVMWLCQPCHKQRHKELKEEF